MFSQVSVCSGGGVPYLHPIISPSHNTSTGPMSFLGVPHNTSTSSMSFPGHTPVTGPRSLLRGYPVTDARYPSPRWEGGNPSWDTPSQVRMGYPFARDRVPTPWPGIGYPLSRLHYNILCCWWYASCSFPQEVFLLFEYCQLCARLVGRVRGIVAHAQKWCHLQMLRSEYWWVRILNVHAHKKMSLSRF